MKLSLLPALALALVPKCPLCWAAWAGVGAALGLGRLGYRPWFVPMLAGLLGLVLVVVAWRAWRRHQYPAAVLAVMGGILVIGGRLVFEHPLSLWIGIAMLALAALGPGRRWPFVRRERTDRGTPSIMVASDCSCVDPRMGLPESSTPFEPAASPENARNRPRNPR